MSADPVQDLARELGSPPPRSVAALSETDAQDLLAAVRAARSRHAAALDTATDHALDHLPRLFRGAVKKVLGL